MTEEQIRSELRAAVKKAGSQRAWARAHGVSHAYVSDFLAGNRGPGPMILQELGYEIIIRKAAK